MAQNHVQEGKVMTWTNGTGSAVVAGQVVIVGFLVGIALGDIASGASGELALEEVWEVTKDATLAISQGADVFWDATNSKATPAAVGLLMGQAFVAAAQAATTVKVRLSSAVRLAAIADPGASGAIPVNRSGAVALTTAAAETRTIARPALAGIELAISLDVDGGNAVITAAAAINQAGNNTITLGDAGDTMVLKAVQVAGALVWRVVVNDGCTLTTV